MKRSLEYRVSVHQNEQLITNFYSAFAAGDHGTMAAAYADDATFSDPVFPNLDADEVRAMWRMFCTSGNDIEVSFDAVQADDRAGSASWEAIYAFPKTGRRVHNKIAASFLFRDGRIVRHRDAFDLYRWTRMALGPVGVALGWTPIVKNQVRSQAAAQLRRA
jgi:ketosteroid isomerase-like protein